MSNTGLTLSKKWSWIGVCSSLRFACIGLTTKRPYCYLTWDEIDEEPLEWLVPGSNPF